MSVDEKNDDFWRALLNSVTHQRNQFADQLAMLDATLTVERSESVKLRERIAELEKPKDE